MERVPGDCEDDGRPVAPPLPRVRFARRTPVEGNRLNGGWSRDLTVLDGGALPRGPPAPGCAGDEGPPGGADGPRAGRPPLAAGDRARHNRGRRGSVR